MGSLSELSERYQKLKENNQEADISLKLKSRENQILRGSLSEMSEENKKLREELKKRAPYKHLNTGTKAAEEGADASMLMSDTLKQSYETYRRRVSENDLIFVAWLSVFAIASFPRLDTRRLRL